VTFSSELHERVDAEAVVLLTIIRELKTVGGKKFVGLDDNVVQLIVVFDPHLTPKLSVFVLVFVLASTHRDLLTDNFRSRPGWARRGASEDRASTARASTRTSAHCAGAYEAFSFSGSSPHPFPAK
jgi:hypothetical protein